MREVDVTDASITLFQILNEVEQGSEITIVRDGQAVGRFIPLPQLRRPLLSRQALRISEPPSLTSSLDTLQNLRQEARH